MARRGRALLQDATRLQPGLADAHGLSAWASLAAGDDAGLRAVSDELTSIGMHAAAADAAAQAQRCGAGKA